MQEHISSYVSSLLATFDIWTALLVFVAYLLIDILYAKYTIFVSRLEPASAATSGSIIYVLLAIGILNFTNNPLYIAPLILGSWIGTYGVVSYERRKKRSSSD